MKRVFLGRCLVIAFVFLFSFSPTSVSSWAQTTKSQAVKTQKARKVSPSKLIMAVQEALNKKGFHLKVDGILGKHTRAAIKKFQKANGIKVTGQADKETLAKLGLAQEKTQ